MSSMSSLTTYWLCRTPGAATEGPFTIGQLRKMHEAGSVTAEAVVCRQGEQEWMGLDDELCAIEIERGPVLNKPQGSAHRLTRRVKTGGSGCGALILFVVGLVICILFFPIGILPGIIVIVAAFLVDGKYGKESCCGACGNAVAATSLQCPNCRSLLDSPPMTSQLWSWIKQAALWVLILIVLTLVVTTVVVKMQGQ